MAGSYGHISHDDGRLRLTMNGTLDLSLLENMGDMAECIEELVGMIFTLADDVVTEIGVDTADHFMAILEHVRDVAGRYRDGLAIADVERF